MNCAIVFALCCLVVAAATAVTNPEWENFKADYGRQYRNPTEEAYRLKIFLSNKMVIDQHNQLYAEGKSTFTMGINQFTDLTNLEYNEMLNHYKPPAIIAESYQSFNYSDVSIPTTVDWRTTGCVYAVKNQGQCGSCWAFSAIACAEFYYCRAKASSVPFSEQELVDCSTSYGNNGCNGGWMDSAFRYITANGISGQSCYPYKAANGVCSPCVVKYTGFKGPIQVQPPAEDALTINLANVGVISVAIDAGRPSFQNYKSGVYNEPTCTTNINHGVLAVGYGVLSGTPYYLVKNSWGTAWGMSGYIMMTRNGSNQCCIACYPSYITI